jgi:hypothetical protein
MPPLGRQDAGAWMAEDGGDWRGDAGSWTPRDGGSWNGDAGSWTPRDGGGWNGDAGFTWPTDGGGHTPWDGGSSCASDADCDCDSLCTTSRVCVPALRPQPQCYASSDCGGGQVCKVMYDARRCWVGSYCAPK